MKKIVLILVLLVTTCSLMAQSIYVPQTQPNKVLVSFFIGPSLDWVQPSTPQYELVNPSLGVRAGVPIDINLSEGENFYFSTGLHVKFENTVLRFPETYTILSNTVSLNTNRYYSNFYFTIPTGIKLKTSISQSSVLGLNIGLYHSLFLSGKSYDEFKLTNVGPDYFIKTGKTDKKYCAMFKESLYAGIGYEYKIKPNLRAYVYANYVFTFTNFFGANSVNSVIPERERATSQGVELLVGIGL